jgi:hypothetical protein
MSRAISKPVTAVSAPVTHSSAHYIGRPRAQLELEREKTDQKASRVPGPTFFRRDAIGHGLPTGKMTSLLPDEKKTLNKGMESSEIPTQTSMTFDMTRNITATILRRTASRPALWMHSTVQNG